jgi:hypothetical protein
VSTDQREYTEAELLASHDFEEPLVAGGVRCHGGFDADGDYVSPRTLHRVPAIRAWQAQHHEDFGTDLLDLPLATWPEHYPNVAQGRFLLQSGVPEPIITTLTRIGTVEGFGAMIRHSVLPDLHSVIEEDTRGTALDHLGRGLYEAHARDEAGFGDEGGHKQMWFAARDVAFDHPVTEDETARIMERMGFASAGGGAPAVAARRAAAMAGRIWPDDVDFDFEILVTRMVRLLLIEISAFHAFAWAGELLSDTELVAGEGEAASLVSCIRADETPHVEYLRTVLSEIRDRTVLGATGRHHAGTDLVARTWDRGIAQSVGANRADNLNLTWREVGHALDSRPDGTDLLARFNELGSIHRLEDGSWSAVDVAA